MLPRVYKYQVKLLHLINTGSECVVLSACLETSQPYIRNVGTNRDEGDHPKGSTAGDKFSGVVEASWVVKVVKVVVVKVTGIAPNVK